jgi:hypothetical protein
MKAEKIDEAVQVSTTPSVSGATKSKRTDVSRKRARRILTDLFGPKVLLRRKAHTKPGARKEIALRTTGSRTRVIGRGRTWLEATLDAAKTMKLAELANAAQTLYDKVHNAPDVHPASV